MGPRGRRSIVAVVLALLLAQVPFVSHADLAKFHTGKPGAEYQTFWCRVVSIDEDYVTLRFRHGSESTEQPVHRTRIESLFFNQRDEHDRMVDLRSEVTQPLQGNLKQYHTVYVTDRFRKRNSDATYWGTGSDLELMGDIVRFDCADDVVAVRCYCEGDSSFIASGTAGAEVTGWKAFKLRAPN